ncbi:MAG: tRNA pseudouridine(38-40) synthase TruA [Paludibacteraceae bacterium]|nr:tRNA pseudouridine(38-40) synthase TruA [Paludibacteraceae bacterium]
MRFFITFTYNGTRYCGWQRQPNGIAVQEELEKALSTILRTPIELTGAGRTDAGVHALNMIAHFDIADDTTVDCQLLTVDSKRLINNLNSLLPYDIAVKNVERVTDDAHARFDALSRKYEYHIITHKNPFLKEQACRIHFPLNIELMNKAAKVLFEYEDFTSFSKLHTDVKTNNCTIMEAYWQQRGEELVFTIKANRFLRNMVRAIVGTLMEVGRERLTIEGFRQVIEAKNRCSAGHSVPACGLYFIEAEYPKTIHNY